MKLKSQFVLRQVADTHVVLPLGKNVLSFDGMLSLNESGAFIWKHLEQGEDLSVIADALAGEYEISREQAMKDIDEFIVKLQKIGCIE